MNEEPEDKSSPQWKNWALMQVGAGGRPVYRINPDTGGIEEYAAAEMRLLAERFADTHKTVNDNGVIL